MRILIVLAALVMAGCGSQAGATPQVVYVTPDPASLPTPQVVYITPAPVSQPTPQVVYVTPEPGQPTTAPTVQPAAELSWKGKDSRTTDPFDLGAGLYRMSWTIGGDDCFIAIEILAVPSGDRVEGLVADTAEGSAALTVDDGGRHVAEVENDGCRDWTLELAPVR
jgi:hypothetical protein